MICKQCGNHVPDGSNVCNYCGNSLGNSGYQQQMGYSGYPGRKIDNIFSALMYERTPGVIMEFTLWCTVCFVVMLSMIAMIMGGGNITWIMLMFFSIGLAVLLAFRLKPISMLYGVAAFNFITFIIHYVSFSKSYDYHDTSYSVLNIILFILLLMASLGIVSCAAVHFFSRFNLGSLLTIMVIADSGLLLILHILMYAASHLGEYASEVNEQVRYYLDYRGYWIGTICFWLILAVITVLYIFFFWGFIDSRKGKIINSTGAKRTYGNAPGIRCMSGMYSGQIILLQGRTVTIGSGTGMTITIQDNNVSARHCAIRFNPTNGFYEIYDDSVTGVYLRNGARLQKGVFNAVQRGSIICAGSMAHQFQLM